MRMALEQALRAKANGEVPVGAVVVKEGQIVGVGANSPITSHDPSAHAEMIALRAAAQTLGNYRLDGCELFVTLEPCPMCAGAILHSRIRRVVFGAMDSKTGAAGSVVNLFANAQLNHHTNVEGGVLSSDCAEMLSSFFGERRQEKARLAEPLQDNALRTPSDAFATLEPISGSSMYFCDAESTAGWRLHYQESGSSDSVATVICLHDVPGWGYDFKELIPALSAVGFRVLVPDLIGFGRSDKPKKQSAHTTEMHIAALLGLLRHVHKSPTLVFLTRGASVHLAQLLRAGGSNTTGAIWQLLSTTSSGAWNETPFPDKGYKAGVLAAPRLVQEFREIASNMMPSLRAQVDQVDGSPEQVANRLWSTAVQR